MFATCSTCWFYQPLEYTDSDHYWVEVFFAMRYHAASAARILPATNSLHFPMTIKLRIARGERLGLVVSLASLWPAAFEILAVKSYGAVHCWNRILDDNDPRFIATGDVIVAANGRTDPTAMIHELLHRRCVSLTLAKPQSHDILSTVCSPLSQRRSCDEILTPIQVFSPTPEIYSPRSECDEVLSPHQVFPRTPDMFSPRSR